MRPPIALWSDADEGLSRGRRHRRALGGHGRPRPCEQHRLLPVLPDRARGLPAAHRHAAGGTGMARFRLGHRGQLLPLQGAGHLPRHSLRPCAAWELSAKTGCSWNTGRSARSWARWPPRARPWSSATTSGPGARPSSRDDVRERILALEGRELPRVPRDAARIKKRRMTALTRRVDAGDDRPAPRRTGRRDRYPRRCIAWRSGERHEADLVDTLREAARRCCRWWRWTAEVVGHVLYTWTIVDT